MNKARCQQCNEVYLPRRYDQRFCCKQCSDAWWAAERTRAIELLRSQTYYGRTLVEAAENPDKYAAVGAEQLAPFPVAVPWPDGDEPPIDGTGEGPILGEALGGAGHE